MAYPVTPVAGFDGNTPEGKEQREQVHRARRPASSGPSKRRQRPAQRQRPLRAAGPPAAWMKER
jgi:hypothetical protein